MNSDLRSAIHVLLPFLIFGVLWIAFTDQIVLKFWSGGVEEMSEAQLFKGILFVVLNGILVFFLVRRYLRVITASNTKQKKVLQYTKDVVYLLDPISLEVRYVNDRINDVLGYRPEEVLNRKDVFLSVLNIDEEKLRKDLGALEEGDSLDREITVNHKDGSHRIINSRITKFYDTDLKKDMFLGVVSDLTQLIKDQADLKRLNERLVDLIDSISDGFMAIRNDWTVSYANEIMGSIAGVAVDDALDKSIWDLMDFEPKSPTKKELLKAYETRENATFETYFAPKKKWLRISIHPGDNMMSLFAQDITKQKEQKLELEKNRRNMAYLMDNLDDLAWSVDLDYKLLSFNRAYEDRCKVFSGEEVKKGISLEHWSKAMNVTVNWSGYFERVLNDYKTLYEVHSERSGVQQVHFEIRVYPILNRKNQIEGLGCVTRDITELKVSEEVIKEQNEVMSAVARFQSHQIRRPVANIQGAIELLQSDPEMVDKSEYRNMIKKSVDELDEMIKLIVQQAHSARSRRD